MAEWTKALVLKTSEVNASQGSNPCPSANKRLGHTNLHAQASKFWFIATDASLPVEVKNVDSVYSKLQDRRRRNIS